MPGNYSVENVKSYISSGVDPYSPIFLKTMEKILKCESLGSFTLSSVDVSMDAVPKIDRRYGKLIAARVIQFVLDMSNSKYVEEKNYRRRLFYVEKVNREGLLSLAEELGYKIQKEAVR